VPSALDDNGEIAGADERKAGRERIAAHRRDDRRAERRQQPEQRHQLLRVCARVGAGLDRRDVQPAAEELAAPRKHECADVLIGVALFELGAKRTHQHGIEQVPRRAGQGQPKSARRELTLEADFGAHAPTAPSVEIMSEAGPGLPSACITST
jgi:hypothetical protein